MSQFVKHQVCPKSTVPTSPRNSVFAVENISNEALYLHSVFTCTHASKMATYADTAYIQCTKAPKNIQHLPTTHADAHSSY